MFVGRHECLGSRVPALARVLDGLRGVQHLRVLGVLEEARGADAQVVLQIRPRAVHDQTARDGQRFGQMQRGVEIVVAQVRTQAGHKQDLHGGEHVRQIMVVHEAVGQLRTHGVV